MKRRVRGFSLLEVIAAILLLAIAFTALMKVAGGSISLTRNAADHSEAALWARSLLDTVDIDYALAARQQRWPLRCALSLASGGVAMEPGASRSQRAAAHGQA